MDRKTLIIILSIAILSILSYMATGAFQGGEVTPGRNGSITETTAGSLDAEGGNVTELNITATVSTERWQGYYGNVSGQLQLGDGTDVFYDFSAATALAVFASTSNSFDFSLLNNVTAAAVDTAWSYNSGNDQAADIFTSYTANVSNVSTPPTVQLTTGAGNTVWNSTALSNGTTVDKTHFAFGVNVSSSANAVCFNGDTCDYELMVPADGLGTDTYYFYVEI